MLPMPMHRRSKSPSLFERKAWGLDSATPIPTATMQASCGLRVLGLGFTTLGKGCEVCKLGFKVWGLGFRVHRDV